MDLPEKRGLKPAKKKAPKKEYAPYVDDQADLPTILEAYHFLIKKFVLNPRERKGRIDKAKSILAAVAGFYEALEYEAENVKKEPEELFFKTEKELERQQVSKNYFTPPDYSMKMEDLRVLQEFEGLQLEDPLLASSKNKRLKMRRKTLAEPMSMEEMLKYRLEEHEKCLFQGTRRKSSELPDLKLRSRKSSNVSDISAYSSSSGNWSRKSSIRRSRKSSLGIGTPKTPRSRSKSPFSREEKTLLEKPKHYRKLSFDLTSTQ